jgi:adenylosuccinate synthase
MDIVVGLGFGDEGKGATVASLLLKNKLLNPFHKNCVVRFSGGQQCGHKVVLEDDKQHIHSSFGSGAIMGIDTYVTEHCSIYPISLLEEYKSLNSRIIVHPLAKVTTPVEVAVNRKSSNFNTTGMGVGYTFSREKLPGGQLRVIDIMNNNTSFLEAKLKSMYQRLYVDYSTEMEEMLQVIQMLKKSDWFKVQVYSHLFNYNYLVFEGSQGTLLDAEHGIFPDVTYASTTVKNVIPFMRYHTLECVYGCTRTYLTRHGKGWFPEQSKIHNPFESNVFNEFQGEFQTAPLDFDLLKHAININKSYLRDKAEFNLVYSCNDVYNLSNYVNIPDLKVNRTIVRESPKSSYAEFLSDF